MAKKIRDKIWIFYFPVTVIYLELVLKLWCFRSVTLRGAVFTLLFSLAVGLLGEFICTVFGGKHMRWTMAVLLFLCALLYGTQAVYFKIFKAFLALYSIGGAGQVIGNFWREALTGIWRTMPALIFIFLPFVLWLIFGKRLVPDSVPKRMWLVSVIACVLVQLAASALVISSNSGVMSARYLYLDTYVPELSVSYFGAMTNLRLDIVSLIRPEAEGSLGASGPDIMAFAPSPMPAKTQGSASSQPVKESPGPAEEAPIVYGDSVMEIDWQELIDSETNSVIKSMHEYFSQRQPSSKNEYTGMFEGKNLVWIVAEGFSTWAMDEELTPTLWKLSHSGFVFENFYNPVWYVSTSDGEYTTLMSQLPRSGMWSMARSARNYQPFSMANLLNSQGYTSYAFHNGTYDYYERNKSHPNLGYTWLADGNGLKVTGVWPPSDLEMIENSTDYYISSEPFHAYYMTISGHMYYTFTGNSMSAKHQDEVASLPYSSNARAYVACQMELDLAVKELIDRLDEAGELDDTVIVLSGDHYPYALETSEIEELNGGPVEQNFELYRTTLIIWNSAMEETVQVDKYCCSLDVLPTLCNLFGLEYDSRLLMGSDALSDSPALIVFGNRSFISDKGRYNAATDTFISNDGIQWADGEEARYAQDTLTQVGNMFTMSNYILDYDYFARVFPQG